MFVLRSRLNVTISGKSLSRIKRLEFLRVGRILGQCWEFLRGFVGVNMDFFWAYILSVVTQNIRPAKQ